MDFSGKMAIHPCQIAIINEVFSPSAAEIAYAQSVLELVGAMTEAGYLAALIHEEYGGIGVGVTEASIILGEIHRQGGNAAACHAQMYIMGTLLRHGSEDQKKRFLPKIASGQLRLQAFGVSEPDTGTNTTSISTAAVRVGEHYRIRGQKIWTSRAQYSDLMLLLARTTPTAEETKRTRGLSVFLIDLQEALGNGVTIEPIEVMINHHTTQVFFDDLFVPADRLVGEEGMGFRYILDGMNAERILIAAECIGDGYWFTDRARQYANERIVFDRPIGQNQGVQFPIAQACAHIRAADLMRYEAARLFDSDQPCGPEANMSKLPAADASWEAASVANAEMRTMQAFLDHPQLAARKRWREFPSPVGNLPALLPPATIAGVEPLMNPVPALANIRMLFSVR